MPDNGEKRAIESWERVELLFEEKRVVGNDEIEVFFEMVRPHFTDGNIGFPVMNMTIRYGVRSLRIPCRRGQMALASTLVDMVNMVQFDAIEIEYNRLSAEYRPIKQETQEEILVKRGDRNAGKGLGKYSKPGKTDRKRNRSSREDRDRG